MEIKAPQSIKLLLKEFVTSFSHYLSDDLLGIYLHGSLAMGSYNPASSDIDLLVVVTQKLTPEQLTDIGTLMMKLSQKITSHGFEMSIVTKDALTHFQYPTPYELHFSDSNKDDFSQGKIRFEEKMTDPDLAAHFVVTKERGICLYGVPISTLFPDVPKSIFLDSIMKDSEWSYKNLLKGSDSGTCRVPVYAVLNFCRILVYMEEGRITSKREGGEWALKNVPHTFNPLIKEALKEYMQSGSAQYVDCQVLKQFGQYAWSLMHK